MKKRSVFGVLWMLVSLGVVAEVSLASEAALKESPQVGKAFAVSAVKGWLESLPETKANASARVSGGARMKVLVYKTRLLRTGLPYRLAAVSLLDGRHLYADDFDLEEVEGLDAEGDAELE